MQRCGRCRREQPLIAFEYDKYGVLRKTCTQCLERVRQQTEIWPPMAEVGTSERHQGQLVEVAGEGVGQRFCSGCQQLRLLVEFDSGGQQQPPLLCRICLAQVSTQSADNILTEEGTQRAAGVQLEEGEAAAMPPPCLGAGAGDGRGRGSQEAGNQQEMQRCGQCRQNKPQGEFDVDMTGNLRRSCRRCLETRRRSRHQAEGGVDAGRHNQVPVHGRRVGTGGETEVPNGHPWARVDREIDEPVEQQMADADRENEVPAPQPRVNAGHEPLEEEAEEIDSPAAVPIVTRSVQRGSTCTAFVETRAQWTAHHLGRMDVVCSGCHALHWAAERGRASTRHAAGTFEACCKHGNAVVEKMQPLPEPLNSLMSGQDRQSREFRAGLWHWNSQFAFTSISYNMDNRPTAIGEGFQLFQVHGAIYHHQGPLVPPGGQDGLYSQMYLYDPAYAAAARSRRAPDLDLLLISSLTEMLQRTCPFIRLYLLARERFAQISEQEQDFRIILDPQLSLIVEHGADMRRENLPTADEVSMILPEEYGRGGFRDIVLAQRLNGEVPNRGFSFINPNHASYLPLHYVLLFPHGEPGWHWGRTLNAAGNNRQNTRLPQRAFFRFRLHPRTDEPLTILRAQRLLQQFVVDAWAICDQNKLSWLQSNQARL
ncbi:hypothetical protein L873DRAFT_769286 [Choiromyces venosus 120613-1]|uniref:Helitron helicase-like domain-containing protein n=1 Tax=Choiromyces venosus 120613-1 TaxID=1336337 RepID=A0A3N4JQ95_9PEZI|nr:hypothetical protein L873DRAFT_769286 [Choiromyces venosus 120613-1]